MPQLALFLLGPMLVTLDEQPVVTFEYDKVRALLAYLAVESDRPHRREALAGLLWPELAESAARRNLRQALATLRRAIGDRAAQPPFLVAGRAEIQWNNAAASWLDVGALTTLLDQAERHPHRHATRCRDCAARLERALALYRGPFMAQFSLPDSAAFEEWVLLKREWLHQRLVSALSPLVAFHEQQGAYAKALGFARRQVELDPWREETHRQVMRLLVLAGERGAALEQYERCRRVLAEELGVEPERETTLFYDQIRDGSPDAPVALSHLTAPAACPHNLPPATTPFVGREQEVADLTALLDSPHSRLVTLVGIGGIGKTRLALQAASAQLDSFADGVFWIPLAGVNAPERLAHVIGETIGLSFARPRQAEPLLVDHLRDRSMLLVLDNFEHLLEGATLLARLLAAAPQVVLLVTSRERLRLQGEVLFPLSGLELPPPGATLAEWEQSHAVKLFLQSAQRVGGSVHRQAEQPWIERICTLLEGSPLAIELAAAWSGLLSCQQIAREIERDLAFLTSTLRDLPARHRSLQAVFDHSWRLLSVEQQRLLGSLALFRGGFRRAAAEQVAGASLPLLGALLDKSLLRRDATGRYDLHELVRQYARRRLAELGEEAPVRRAFLAYFVGLAERAEPAFAGPEQGKWLARVEEEHANILAALEYALADGAAGAGLRLVVALYRYWHWRTYVDEGRQWLETMLAATQTDESLGALRARAFHAAGVMALEQGEYDQASALLEEGLALRRALGDRSGEAASLNSLGVVAWELGDHAAAQALLERSLALRRALGQPQLLIGPLNNLGLVALARQEYQAAQTAFEEMLAINSALAVPNPTAEAAARLNLGMLMLDRGEPARARPYMLDSLALHWELEEKDGVAYGLEGAAGILVAGGEEAAARSAARLFGAAARLRAAINMPLSPTERIRYDRHVDGARATLGQAPFDEAWQAGESLTLAQAVEQATALLAGAERRRHG